MRFAKSVYVNDDFLDVLGSEQLYFIGLMASDGNVSKLGRLSISQSKECGLDIITYLKRVLNYSGNILEIVTASGNTSYQLSFASPKMLQALAKFNMTQNKSLTYECPAPALLKEDISSFVRGYFDGDGCIGTYSVGQSTEYLKMSIYGSFSFIESIYALIPVKGIISKRKTGAEIVWNGRKGEEFGNWLFSNEDLFKSIKYNKFQDYKKVSKKYNASDVARAKAMVLYENGMPIMEIASTLRVNFQVVYKWRAKWNWKCKSISEVENP